MRKTFLATVLISVTLLAGCGGGGSGSGNGGGGIAGGSCSSMLTGFVNTSECWEFSSDETNAITYCAAATGVHSALACDEAGKVATCTSILPPSPLTGTLFTVYWFTGSYPLDFDIECSGTIRGDLTDL